MNEDFLLSSYHYELPKELIAQSPCDNRAKARLLVLNRKRKGLEHLRFKDIGRFLRKDDCLVVNRTKVFPARLISRKPTGGKVEFLLLELPQEIGKGISKVTALSRSSKPLRPGQVISFPQEIKIEVKDRGENGIVNILIHYKNDLVSSLEKIGIMPLPPYIKRQRPLELDRKRYQTIYAKELGSVAAPTAGLHFTQELLDSLRAKGVKIAPITLHVGYGTFSPIRTEDIRKHKIHREWVSIPGESAQIINETRKVGGRIVAVGTTSVRTIEFVMAKMGKMEEFTGECDLYIYPGFRFQITDAMITNFHLPGSSLLVLVSAFCGRKKILRTYEEAVRKRYRFFSYGDAMLIL